MGWSYYMRIIEQYQKISLGRYPNGRRLIETDMGFVVQRQTSKKSWFDTGKPFYDLDDARDEYERQITFIKEMK